jgi:orotate phosphoribosyltransferase
MHYRSIAQLSDQVCAWSRRLPQDFDLVVGIPRSGMLVANLLALYWNIPFTDLDGFLEGRLLGGGRRYAQKEEKRVGNISRVLVVDDSVYAGQSIGRAKERIATATLSYEIAYGAVYVNPIHHDIVDYYCELLPLPRIFEWNILQSSLLAKSCFDIDGVLCKDPLSRVNDDGELYSAWLPEAQVHLIPEREIGWLVTSRLEKYRAETEEWLLKHGVQYRELIMLDLPDAETRRRSKIHSSFKGEVYRGTGARMFFESSLTQAVTICNVARKPVFCVDTMQMIYPGNTPVNRLEGNGHEPWLRTMGTLRKRAFKAYRGLKGVIGIKK